VEGGSAPHRTARRSASLVVWLPQAQHRPHTVAMVAFPEAVLILPASLVGNPHIALDYLAGLGTQMLDLRLKRSRTDGSWPTRMILSREREEGRSRALADPPFRIVAVGRQVSTPADWFEPFPV
jgi:hypothetical protein